MGKKKKSQRGGAFDIGRELEKYGREADKVLKKTQIISKGLNAAAEPAGKLLTMIPHPAGTVAGLVAPAALKVAGSVASQYGYGYGGKIPVDALRRSRSDLGARVNRPMYQRGGSALRSVRGAVFY